MISLTILTPKGKVFEGEVESLLIPAHNGPLQIEQGYTPSIVACLPAGVARITRSGKPAYYAIFSGVAHVRPTGITLLAEAFENGYEIDMAKAIAGRDRELDRIASKDPNVDVALARLALNKELARIKAKTMGEGGE